MTSRLAVGMGTIVIMLPLVVGLLVGSMIAIVTLSWGNVWQLFWWSFVAAAVWIVTSSVVGRITDIIPEDLPERRLNQSLHIIRAVDWLKYGCLVAGLSASIWAMVVSGTANASIGIYWLLPFAAYLFKASGPARDKLCDISNKRIRANRELQRKSRCSDLTSEQRGRYAKEFLMKLYSLTQAASADVTQIALSQIIAKLKHDCTPELMPIALQHWRDQELITVNSNDTRVVLTAKGKAVSSWIQSGSSPGEALKRYDKELRIERERKRVEDARHKRCLDANIQEQIEFEGKFLSALFAAMKGDAGGVLLKEIWRHLNHECQSELSEGAIKVWVERGCMDIKIGQHFKRGSWEAGLGLVMANLGRLGLTAAGRDLCVRGMQLGSIQKAWSEQRESRPVTHNEYNVHNTGNIGAVGPYANVHHNEFTQFVNAFDRVRLQELARELETLGKVLHEQAKTAEHRATAGAIAGAEVAARAGDQQGVWQHLAKVGRWALETANQIGVAVAAEAIKAVFKG